MMQNFNNNNIRESIVRYHTLQDNDQNDYLERICTIGLMDINAIFENKHTYIVYSTYIQPRWIIF